MAWMPGTAPYFCVLSSGVVVGEVGPAEGGANGKQRRTLRHPSLLCKIQPHRISNITSTTLGHFGMLTVILIPHPGQGPIETLQHARCDARPIPVHDHQTRAEINICSTEDLPGYFMTTDNYFSLSVSSSGYFTAFAFAKATSRTNELLAQKLPSKLMSYQ
jgi:hypothetical protein